MSNASSEQGNLNKSIKFPTLIQLPDRIPLQVKLNLNRLNGWKHSSDCVVFLANIHFVSKVNLDIKLEQATRQE